MLPNLAVLKLPHQGMLSCAAVQADCCNCNKFSCVHCCTFKDVFTCYRSSCRSCVLLQHFSRGC